MRPTRWHWLGGGVVGGLVASLVLVVALRGERVDVLALAIYVLGFGGVPFLVAPRRRLFEIVVTFAVLAELFMAAWGLVPLLPVAIGQLGALWAARPSFRDRALRRAGASVAAAGAVLAIATVVFVPGPSTPVVACVDGASASNAVFRVAEDFDVEGVDGGSGAGTAVDVDDWASDAEVARLVTALEELRGVERVVRSDDPTACR